MSGFLKKTVGAISARKERIGILLVGYLGNAVMVYSFNYLLYPFVIWKLGIMKGGAVMAFLSFVVCYLTLIFYDWAKKDWLGIETVKGIREKGGVTKAGKITSWFLRKSDPVVLLFLSVKFDPFITVVYMRKGSNQYNGLTNRDWKIFFASFLIGNFYWLLAVSLGLEVIRRIWNTHFLV